MKSIDNATFGDFAKLKVAAWARLDGSRLSPPVASENLHPAPTTWLAVAGESGHDRRMITIAVLFVRVLCDCFKPRRRLEAEILVLRHQ
ncbi:MAG: hypothetical protein WCC90_17030, partial [Methylocella sp.]